MSAPGRGGLAVAAVSGLAAAFLMGMVVGGGTATVAPPIETGQPPDSPLTLVNADLTLPGGCEALLDSYVERGVERVGPWGWDSPMVYAFDDGLMPSAAGADSAAESTVRSAGVVEQGSSATGTNVQEVGVDEPDVVKTDGELLVRTRDGDLQVHDVTGPTPVEVADVDLPSSGGAPELLLVGDRVVVVTSGDELSRTSTTRLTTYDISDPAAPVLVDDRSFDTGLVRAVQREDTIRLVLSRALPDLDFVQPRFWRSDGGALERNQDVVRASSIEDWLPMVTSYDTDQDETGTEQLLECDEVTVPSEESAALGTIAVVGFDAADPGDADTLGVATDTRLAYVSPTRMYLGSSPWSAWGCCWMPELPGPGGVEDTGRTRIYAFELDGTDTTYTASGVVDGVVTDRWAMDEHDGVLRLAVGQSQETGNFNSVLTLREDGDVLEEVGRVDKLGVNEEIKAVRWFDGLAIVVTFRQVDPLYAIDLTDADAPRLLGELKIPGFSEYLHPISGQRLIGLGQDALTNGALRGAQAALFDVSDLTDPQRTDQVGYAR
ncbi:MAG: beta-propeller domain-containing protein, partial [Nocardioides sp.]